MRYCQVYLRYIIQSYIYKIDKILILYYGQQIFYYNQVHLLFFMYHTNIIVFYSIKSSNNL